MKSEKPWTRARGRAEFLISFAVHCSLSLPTPSGIVRNVAFNAGRRGIPGTQLISTYEERAVSCTFVHRPTVTTVTIVATGTSAFWPRRLYAQPPIARTYYYFGRESVAHKLSLSCDCVDKKRHDYIFLAW